MPYFVNTDGTATDIDWDTDECERRINDGENYFATLAGCVIHKSVQATAFHRAIKATPLYDGRIYFDEGRKVQVGIASEYRICAAPGLYIHPPLSPKDFCAILDGASRMASEQTSR